MKNCLNSLLRSGILLIGLLISHLTGFGQHEPGPYSFNPFVGNLVWEDSEEATLASRTVTMDNLQPLSNGEDGLIVIFHVHLRSSDEMTPLVAFSTTGTQGNNLIEIYYSKSTVTLRRYADINGQRKQYDYHLFDPLFVFSGDRDFEFRTYFTSNFMYLVSKDQTQNPGFEMSPIYFGLDQGLTFSPTDESTKDSNMGLFINRSASATIKVGDPSGNHSPFISSIQIYGLGYGDWAKQMQENFSSPNPASSN